MNSRWLQGTYIVIGSAIVFAVTLASAVAWGPHHCEDHHWSLKIIGCALGSYENLSGGLFAACAAVFAGWMAWTAVQLQISADERRAVADRAEVESVLADDIDQIAEALAAVWTTLEQLEAEESGQSIAVGPTLIAQRRNAVRWSIAEITQQAWIDTTRKMVSVLGWRRRRAYEHVLTSLERLRGQPETFDVFEMQQATQLASAYVLSVAPKTSEYFDTSTIFHRGGKAWTIGYSILMQAGLTESA
jgi:hypothetical protein